MVKKKSDVLFSLFGESNSFFKLNKESTTKPILKVEPLTIALQIGCSNP
jgi:hypothetical protein